MADEYRRITRQCAKDDWPRCRAHADVVQRYSEQDIVKQFLGQTPATWFTQTALRERRRRLRADQPSPGTRPIGQLKVEGFRAWVWEDDGSVYDVQGRFAGSDIYWMIAYGNRRKGDRSDLQEKRKSLLQDPDDTWRPGDDDYADLLQEHDDGFTDRSITAIKHAAAAAEEHPNTVVTIESEELSGHVVHDHEEDVVEGMVIAETNERWLLLSKRRRGGRPLTYEDAVLLSVAAYPDRVDAGSVWQLERIRGDLAVADPATHWIFYAELPS